MKIVRTDMELEMPLVDKTLIENGHDLILLPDGIAEDKLCEEIIDCEILLMCYTPITQKVLDAANKLKAIVKYGVGIDAIDIPAAKEKGIIVVNIPEYAEETVAEGAFAMLIALAQHQMNTKEWAWPSQKWLGVDIAEKTVGIIGCGKIGTSMARMAGAGFKAKVIGYDPNKSKEELAENGIEKYDDLKEMIQQCDFITLHSVLNNETKHIVGKDELAVMKETAFIINSARGALIDELALLDALENKQIAGAGIDVFSIEAVSNGECNSLPSSYVLHERGHGTS
jgi:D-3-phosphoglycerate dehydrogenase